LDEQFAKIIERAASKPLERLDAIKQIFQEGIETYTFISPYFPEITDYKRIIENVKGFSNRFLFENLNFRPHNIPRIMRVISEKFPNLKHIYKDLQKDQSYWDILESEIKKYCEEKKLDYSIEFHHGGFSKS
jgi:DNA repair photolyase